MGQDAADVLASVRIHVEGLPGSDLGFATGDSIWIDMDASGFGWFVDTTHRDDKELGQLVTGTQLLAPIDSEAYGHIDLLTVIMHELGHALGLQHSDDSRDLMAEELAPGIRKLPQLVTDYI